MAPGPAPRLPPTASFSAQGGYPRLARPIGALAGDAMLIERQIRLEWCAAQLSIQVGAAPGNRDVLPAVGGGVKLAPGLRRGVRVFRAGFVTRQNNWGRFDGRQRRA